MALKNSLGDFKWRLKSYLPKRTGEHLGVILIALVSIPLGVYLLSQAISYFSKAAANTVDVYFQPATQTLSPSTPTTNYKIMMNAGSYQVGFARVDVTFDPTKVRLNSEIAPGTALTNVIQTTSMATANSTGHITLVYALPAPAPNPVPSTGVFQFASFDLTVATQSQDQTATLDFVTSTMQIVDLNTNALLINATSATLTLNPSSNTTGASLYFSAPRPSNPQTTGSAFDIDVMVDTGGQSVDGVDAVMTFDKSFLAVQGISQPTSPVFASYPISTFDNSAGLITISANIGSGNSATPVNGNAIIATLHVKPLAQTSSTKISYVFTPGSRNDSNVVLSGTLSGGDPQDILSSVVNADIVVGTQTTTPTPTPYVTTIPTPTKAPTSTPIPSACSCSATLSPTSSSINVGGSTAYTMQVSNTSSGCSVSRVNFSSSNTSVATVSPTSDSAAPYNTTATGTSAGNTAINGQVVMSDGNIGCSNQSNMTVSSSAPTPTTAPTTQSVTFKFLFQGRTRTGVSNNLGINFYFKKAGTTSVYGPYGIGLNSDGTFQTSFVNGGYSFLVQTPGYLAKRFGTDNNPINIPVTNGVLDLTGSPLLGGDLNGDGVINSVDYSTFITRFRTSYATADLDASGQVNNLDFGIMRSNWGKTGDVLQ